MRPIAKSAKRQVKSTESSHIVNTTLRLYHNAVVIQTLDLDSKFSAEYRGKYSWIEFRETLKHISFYPYLKVNLFETKELTPPFCFSISWIENAWQNRDFRQVHGYMKQLLVELQEFFFWAMKKCSKATQ